MLSNVVNFCQCLQNGNELIELCATHVIIPTLSRQSILRVKEVRSRAVVNDNAVFQVSINSAQILHKDAIVECALLSEKSIGYQVLGIQPI